MADNRVQLPMVGNSPRLQIEYIPLTALKLNTSNPRRHSQKQITNIARNIDKVGFVVPCLIDDESRVLAGNARIEAAARLGMASVPVVRLRHLSEPEKRALIIADNRLPELASWDETSLRQELSFLNDLDFDFDFSAIGFDTAEVDFLLGGTEADDQADALPAMVDVPAVSQPSDLWLLNHHRLYCGSALERSSHDAVLAGVRAAMRSTLRGGAGVALAAESADQQLDELVLTGSRLLERAKANGSAPKLECLTTCTGGIEKCSVSQP